MIKDIISAYEFVNKNGNNLYVSLGETISITKFDGVSYKGILKNVELSQYEEVDDVILLDTSHGEVEIQCSHIKAIHDNEPMEKFRKICSKAQKWTW